MPTLRSVKCRKLSDSALSAGPPNSASNHSENFQDDTVTPSRRSARNRRPPSRPDCPVSPTHSALHDASGRLSSTRLKTSLQSTENSPASERAAKQQRRRRNNATDWNNQGDASTEPEDVGPQLSMPTRKSRSSSQSNVHVLESLPNRITSPRTVISKYSDRPASKIRPNNTDEGVDTPQLRSHRKPRSKNKKTTTESDDDIPMLESGPTEDNGLEDTNTKMDWLIDNIADNPEEVQAIDTRPDTEMEPQPAPPTDEPFGVLRSIAIAKINRRRRVSLQNLSAERGKVHSLLHATVTAFEGNSMLLLGPHGAGKTALVEDVLAELNSDPVLAETFHVVRLDGLIQNEDNLALREIWRQLGSEMNLIENGGGKSYADALASLLNVLFQSERLANQSPSQLETNHPEATADRKVNSIIFILSSFEVFAARPRQTLLYNLFDVAQSRTAPIAVLGLSTRLDAADMLEKRVKSRFSHRSVLIPAARSLQAFKQVVDAAVHVTSDELSLAERQRLSPEQIAAWNAAVDAQLSSESTVQTLGEIYATSKSIPEALTSLLMPLYTLAPTSSAPTSTAALLQPSSSPLHALSHLSTLSLALLIAAARLPLLHTADATSTAATAASPINLSLAYAEYKRLASAARISGAAAAGGAVVARVWGREVARGAWEALVRSGLVVPEGGGPAVGETEMCRVEVALEEIEPAVAGGLDSVLRRWCREL